MKISFEVSRGRAESINKSQSPGQTRMGSALRPVVTTPEQARHDIAQFRMLTEMNERMERAFLAGVTDNYNQDLRGTYGDANTEMLPYDYKIRARTRTIAKDTTHGKAVCVTFADNIVGDDPFELEVKVGEWQQQKKEGQEKPMRKFVPEIKTNEAIKALWKRFCQKQNFTVRRNQWFGDAMWTCVLGSVRDGLTICRLHDDYPNEFGFAVDFLEQDHLQREWQGRSGKESRYGSGNPIRGSIEFHPRWNYPLAYWLLTRHPGAMFVQPAFPEMTTQQANKIYREQVPADNIILFENLHNRAEQDQGFTELDATVQPLWRMEQYDKSLTITAIVSCIRAFVVETDAPTGIPLTPEQQEQYSNGVGGADVPQQAVPGTDPAQTQNRAGSPAQQMKPGMREELPVGKKAKILSSDFPKEAQHTFKLDLARDIAIATHGSYQHASGDYQNLGFMAALSCRQPFERRIRIRQNSVVQNLNILFRAFLKRAIMKGHPLAEGLLLTRLDEYCDAATFKPQGFSFINPLVEAQAYIILNEAGHMTRQQVQDRLPNGKDIGELYADFENENDEMASHNLDFANQDVTRPTISKGEPGQTVPNTDDDIQPPSKTRPANPVRRQRMIESLTQASLNGEH